MPYINEKEREELDDAIDNLILAIRNDFTEHKSLKDCLGRINYCFSRILSGIMGSPAYTKIAIITGVLENIKQEFYRRVASAYEDKKIIENGDIKEYKRLT